MTNRLPPRPFFRRARHVLLLVSGLLALFLLAGCPTDGKRDTFDYLRSPLSFRMDPVPADHPFCSDPAQRLDLSEQECRAASKYRLRWERPEDTVGFSEYRIYVDTTPPGTTMPWSEVRTERSLASFVLEGRPPMADSIIFVLADSGALGRELSRNAPGLVPLDTTGRFDSTGRLIFAVATGYRESGLDGTPAYTWAITTDRFPPFPLQPAFSPQATSLTVEWDRPRDPTSFFEPGADSGLIRAYYLRVVRGGVLGANRPGDTAGFRNVTVTYHAGGVDRTAEVTRTDFRSLRGAPGVLFRLPDSMRVQNRLARVAADSLRVTLTGFLPQDTLDVGLWAMDSVGNVSSDSSVTAATRILLTDTTQPVRPVLSLVSAARNGFIYSFTASRDLVESGSGLVPAPQPNANILEYRISRITLGPGGVGMTGSRDTVLQIPPNLRDSTAFTDTVRHLPPGADYLIVIRAVDSTGHVSAADSLTVSTTEVRFPGADSAATCPPGFVAIPGGRFMLGDTSAIAGSDERPARFHVAPSYCIETLEHRDAAGAFVTGVTWQQAHDACRDMAADRLTPADSTWLCTEAEWERACEGAEPDLPLAYGMQSERSAPGNVRYACNIGTSDSLMAQSAALRDPSCISYDGALDMSGNFAEWVLDPYTTQYPAMPESLSRGVPHTTPAAGARRNFRGSNYLNPNESPAVLLSRARCSNRNYAAQSRPRPFPGCVSADGPQMVVTYNNVNKPPRCLPLPAGVAASDIDSLIPARDSSQILILLSGIPQPRVYPLPADTAYIAQGLRPIAASLTRQTLAIVTFRNEETNETVVDTLHTTGLLNAPPATQEAVFRREAAPPWSVVMAGGSYAITYRYAHIQTRSVPAKAYYSNPAIGFRCCSRPRP